MKKKIISLLVVLSLILLTIGAVTVSAATGDSEDNPVICRTFAEVQNVMNREGDKYIKLIGDSNETLEFSIMNQSGYLINFGGNKHLQIEGTHNVSLSMDDTGTSMFFLGNSGDLTLNGAGTVNVTFMPYKNTGTKWFMFSNNGNLAVNSGTYNAISKSSICHVSLLNANGNIGRAEFCGGTFNLTEPTLLDDSSVFVVPDGSQYHDKCVAIYGGTFDCGLRPYFMRTHSHATVYINPYIIFHGGKLIRLDNKQAKKCKEANPDVEITYNQSTLSTEGYTATLYYNIAELNFEGTNPNDGMKYPDSVTDYTCKYNSVQITSVKTTISGEDVKRTAHYNDSIRIAVYFSLKSGKLDEDLKVTIGGVNATVTRISSESGWAYIDHKVGYNKTIYDVIISSDVQYEENENVNIYTAAKSEFGVNYCWQILTDSGYVDLTNDTEHCDEILGRNQSNLNITAADSYYDGKTFRCKISNQYGNAYTAPVTVKMVGESFVYGDVNGDKEIDSVDLTRLKKNLAGQPVTVSKGADCHTDKVVDALDLTRLKKYLAGQPVVLGPGKEAEE